MFGLKGPINITVPILIRAIRKQFVVKFTTHFSMTVIFFLHINQLQPQLNEHKFNRNISGVALNQPHALSCTVILMGCHDNGRLNFQRNNKIFKPLLQAPKAVFFFTRERCSLWAPCLLNSFKPFGEII